MDTYQFEFVSDFIHETLGESCGTQGFSQGLRLRAMVAAGLLSEDHGREVETLRFAEG